MATDRQIEANRANSKFSTGPKNTSKTRFNALNWGIKAADTVCPQLGESMEEFETFQRDMLEDIQPAGAREEQLSHRFIRVEWQLNRLDRIATGVFTRQFERDYRGKEPTKDTPAAIFQSISNMQVDLLSKLSNERQRLANQSSKLTRELRQLQKDRKSAEIATVAKPENEANSEQPPIESTPLKIVRWPAPAEKEADADLVPENEVIG